MQKSLLAVLASGIWVSLSEFARNELAFKALWLERYGANGMVFPSDPINNALWGLWSFLLAGGIVFLLQKMRFVETILVSWFMAFVLMWVVIGNLNVLPSGLLIYAVPWSLCEVGIAAWIGRKILGT